MHEELAKLLPKYMDKNTIIIGKIYGRIERVAKLVRERKVRFLFGAGMSRGSGTVLFSTLASQMVRDICKGTKDFQEKDIESILHSYPPEAIVQAYLDLCNSTGLRDILRKSFARIDAKIHAGHEVLQWLVNNEYIDRVYTTNFEYLIEDAFNGGDKGRAVTITDDNIDEIDSVLLEGRIPVMHLHGGLRSKCLISEKDTYTLNTRLARIFMSDMMQKRVVLVGYSMRDMDLRSLYFSVREMLTKDLAKKTYAVLPLETDKDWGWRVADSVWNGRGVPLIPMEAEKFFPYLRERIESQKSGEFIPHIKEKMNIDDPELNRKIERLEKLGMTRDEAIKVLATNLGILEGRK